MDLSTVRSKRRPPANPPSIPTGLRVQKTVPGSTTISDTGTATVSITEINTNIKNFLFNGANPTFNFSILKAVFWAPAADGSVGLQVSNKFDGGRFIDYGSYVSRPCVSMSMPSRQQTDFNDSSTGTAFEIAFTAGAIITFHITISLRTGVDEATLGRPNVDENLIRQVLRSMVGEDVPMDSTPTAKIAIRDRLSRRFGRD